MVSLGYYTAYLDDVSLQRLAALELHQDYMSTLRRLKPARLKLAPTGDALTGILDIMGEPNTVVAKEALASAIVDDDATRAGHTILAQLGVKGVPVRIRVVPIVVNAMRSHV